MNITTQIAQLTDQAYKLNNRDREFAVSLIEQFQRRGSLSEKQLPWLEKLLARAKGEEKPAAAPASQDGGIVFTKITEMFDKAAESLKAPRVQFSSTSGEFLVRRAKPDSRNPGHLYVVFGGDYVGKIAPNGRFWPTRECPKAVEQALVEFNKNPQQVAAAYGQSTGNCCFCARELTDPRSVEVGYGPICADRFGLPWGA